MEGENLSDGASTSRSSASDTPSALSYAAVQKMLKGLLEVAKFYSNFVDQKIKEEQQQYSNTNLSSISTRRSKGLIEINLNHNQNGNSNESNKVILDNMNYFHGTLRSYQKEGVLWLKLLYQNSINGILGDEMGLGKTIQVIAFICHLTEKGVEGPHLIVGPLSVLKNWESEFSKFAPNYPTVLFYGKDRQYLRSLILKKYTYHGRSIAPVVITNYNTFMSELNFLQSINWCYLIVDEAQRIKNFECKLVKELSMIPTKNRLILTGTPIQNNITELWSLCNFVMPELFKDVKNFSSLIKYLDFQDTDALLQREEETKTISMIRRILAPFLLRRLKSDVLDDIMPKKSIDVFCPLSDHQKDLYRYVLDRDIQKLLGRKQQELDVNTPRSKRPRMEQSYACFFKESSESSDSESEESPENVEPAQKHPFQLETVEGDEEVIFKTRLTMASSSVMLRKIVSHPYLVHFPIKKKTGEMYVSEKLITESGKLTVLDAMLPKLKKKNHKILLFSTMVMTLDILEEYLIYRKYSFRRLDGGNSLEIREKSINDFNIDPKIFIFLISTRAGGTGINLMGADTVIFYDKDWNPQVDLQAEDRCHRIGQTKPVVIYSLITKNTIDEKIVYTSNLKNRLSKVIVSEEHFKYIKVERSTSENDLADLKTLLDNINKTSSSIEYSDSDLDQLVCRQDLISMVQEKTSNVKENLF